MTAKNRSAETAAATPALLGYYEAIERASADMLSAARQGRWDEVLKLEGACAVLISQLKEAARKSQLDSEQALLKSRIMQRILVNDAEVRHLAEPWLQDLELLMAQGRRTLH